MTPSAANSDGRPSLRKMVVASVALLVLASVLSVGLCGPGRHQTGVGPGSTDGLYVTNRGEADVHVTIGLTPVSPQQPGTVLVRATAGLRVLDDIPPEVRRLDASFLVAPSGHSSWRYRMSVPLPPVDKDGPPHCLWIAIAPFVSAQVLRRDSSPATGCANSGARWRQLAPGRGVSVVNATDPPTLLHKVRVAQQDVGEVEVPVLHPQETWYISMQPGDGTIGTVRVCYTLPCGTQRREEQFVEDEHNWIRLR